MDGPYLADGDRELPILHCCLTIKWTDCALYTKAQDPEQGFCHRLSQSGHLMPLDLGSAPPSRSVLTATGYTKSVLDGRKVNIH